MFKVMTNQTCDRRTFETPSTPETPSRPITMLEDNPKSRKHFHIQDWDELQKLQNLFLKNTVI